MALDINQSDLNDLKSSETSVGSKRVSLFENKKISAKDRIFFFQQILLLLQTGTQLKDGLSALEKQTDKVGIRNLLSGLVELIEQGKSFSYALSQYPDVFNTTHINLISAGEEGGFVDKVLQQIIDMEERRSKLKETLLSAVSYPLFLAIFSFGVVVFILMVVFPKFSVLFTKIHDHLPVTTKILMSISELLINHWMIVIVLLAGLAGVLYKWLKSEYGQRKFDEYKLSFPILKSIFIQIYMVQSLRVMYLSLSNGVSIVDTLHSCKNTVRNKMYQEFISKIESLVLEGGTISSGFSKAEFVPPLVKQMISTGEEAGRLPIVMGKIADHYEEELLKKLKALSKLAEPIMLVIMGAVVGIIVSSLILPIFMLSRVVN